MTTRTRVRPWVGRSYAHVVMPSPHLDDELRERFNAGLAPDGWEPVADDEVQARDRGLPVLIYRWRHRDAGTLMLTVLAWYPLTFTIGPERRTGSKQRRALSRLVDIAIAAGGHELPDGDLDRVVQACRSRWDRVIEARHVVEEHRKWLECRQCRSCGAWSGYGVLHCNGCARRFSPADDAERNERGRAAAEVTATAERTLHSLGRGEGLFSDWPPKQEPVVTTALAELAGSGSRSGT